MRTTSAYLKGAYGRTVETSRTAWTLLRVRGPGQMQFWFIALALGIAAGLAAVGFQLAIFRLQSLLYGTDDPSRLGSFAASLPWWWVLTLPVLGGLAVGLILHRFTPDGRVRSVADVIEGCALREGRVEKRAGLASALASLITLSSGGSTGREGPAVHLAAVISAWVSNLIRAQGVTARDLLGCATAAAVSASFNAPIAGALFALEVVLRHFAVHAFAPIAIASVAGTVVARSILGEQYEFDLGGQGVLQFYAELPAYMLLGLLSGLVAVVMMRSVFWADDAGDRVQRALRMPRWLRPAAAGLLLGAIAIPFPHIIGVGYETTFNALLGNYFLWQAVVFVAVKVAAVAITMAGRMGGGVFSPSLMVGALLGLAFGVVATSVFPEQSGAETLYALAGMGAVAAAVLGAPISTTLIVFELTGDWQTGLAVMVAVSLATAVASRLVDRSFFLTQLERKGVHLAAGPQAYLLSLATARALMRPLGHPEGASEESLREMIGRGVWLAPGATLETAMPMFDKLGRYVPVAEVQADGPPEPLGALFQIDALLAYSKALAATAAEEHS